ncbi:hypothetical protein IGI04_003125 [Brassica rapa subsp. trilocularis]|uniref:Cyclin C-terminal domain-containing protein n=1 Tax=Brassica rapa subsp. trilocularis TaxID=1813537 RepID=A0ABQ7NXJ0_BRACM|nr:hypothetical protein IGI04_003125 [Brassica rapa subsp. trilocularis]
MRKLRVKLDLRINHVELGLSLVISDSDFKVMLLMVMNEPTRFSKWEPSTPEIYAFLVGKQLNVTQESLQKLKEFDIRMNHISIAAAVIYITTQLSDEKKPLRDLQNEL